MNNATRLFFAFPALLSGATVLWLVLAEHQVVASPQDFLTHIQQIGTSVTTGTVQTPGIKP